MDTGIAALRRIEAFVFRCPIKTPVRTSFGVMHDRPAVFVRIEDRDGCQGWGEAWCNFPSFGAAHRARIVNELLAPLLVGKSFDSPLAAFKELTTHVAIISIQSGESGPFAQAIAGVDIALWDLASRRIGQPLWRFLGGASQEIGVYASGINPTNPERVVGQTHRAGHRAFKLKVGFNLQLDRRNVATVREAVGNDATLAVDANQAWTLSEAKAIVPTFDQFRLAWIEEPLRADRPWSEWRELEKVTQTALAAGENIAGADTFAAAVSEDVLRVVQPDMAKWGGFSGCLPVARNILASGALYCPHFLGAGVGLAASAHLLAAAGGDGLLEIDVNENPLRDAVAGPMMVIDNGRIRLSDEPGLGVVPNFDALRPYQVSVL